MSARIAQSAPTHQAFQPRRNFAQRGSEFGIRHRLSDESQPKWLRIFLWSVMGLVTVYAVKLAVIGG